MHRILVTSCKGGVGKSTVSAGIAAALASRGKKVLLIDFDLGNRSLDLMLGLEDAVLYDVCDLAAGRIGADSAILIHPKYPNLAFVAAPFRYEGDLTAENFGRALSLLEETGDYDFVLIDTSGGAHESVALSAPFCETALIVSSQNPTSIRAAEKSGLILDEFGVGEQRLVINGFDMQKENLGKRAGVIEMIDRTRTPLCGIIPLDPRLTLLSEQGQTALDGGKTNARTAFENIAGRLCGENIPLLRGFCGIRRKQLLFS
ncbi:MAG: P-loop NTPase [Clostridia bacterium]|nr:P-loop NTPase [Clostridia bacterium]